MGTRQALAVLVCGTVLFGGMAASASASDKPGDQYYASTVTSLGNDKYQIDVSNMNPKGGFIRTFWWVPPIALTITRLTRVQGGKCTLSGGITCSGSIPPPSCFSCIGGNMTIDFNATGLEPTFVKTSYGGYYIQNAVTGAFEVTSVTQFSDLPSCKKGEVTTKAKPCGSST